MMTMLAGLLIVGCNADTPILAHHLVRDSAGVRIIDNTVGDTNRPAISIAESPFLTIGREDGEKWDALDKVSYAARLPNGDFAIVNRNPAEVFLYDSAGVYKSSIGRAGQGPGEFRYPTWVGVQADSFVVLDEMYPSRISIFNSAGTFVRRAPLSTQSHLGEAAVRGVFVDGSFLLLGSRKRCNELAPPAGTYWNCVEAYASDHRTGKTSMIPGLFPSSLGDLRTWMFRASADLAAHENRFFLANIHTFELRRYTRSGQLEWVARVNRARTSVTEAHKQEFTAMREKHLAQYGATTRAELLARAPTDFPDSMSAYQRVVPTQDGGAWAQHYTYPPNNVPQRWDVFDSLGVFHGTMKLPSTVHVHQVGADFLLVVTGDSLDVERVALFRLQRARDK